MAIKEPPPRARRFSLRAKQRTKAVISNTSQLLGVSAMRTVFSRLLIVILAASIAACASSRALDKSFTDLSAGADLKGVLFSDRSYDYGDIDITIYEGRLLLTGAMQSEDGRKKLVENAWKADGVTQIIDEIFVGDKTPFGQGFEDMRIDQTLRAKLIASSGVTSGDYKIAVSGGVVYLLGSAGAQNERDKALNLARAIAGVKKVVSYVTLRSPIAAQ